MRIMFNGVIEKARKGCGACGKRRSESEFRTSKTYILPSGNTKTFRIGKAEEVTERDAEFLLTYNYLSPEGEVKSVFEVV